MKQSTTSRLCPGQLIVRFDKDQRRIDQLKALPNTRWSPLHSGWLVPEEVAPSWASALPYPVKTQGAKLWPRLMPHQREPVLKAARERCHMFAWDMGTGKSLAALAATELVAPKAPLLIVCPASVVPNWGHELALWDWKHETHVVSYNSVGATELKQKWGAIIFDETVNLGNRASSFTKTCQSIVLANPDAARFALNGTPLTARLDSIWTQFTTLSPRIDHHPEGGEYMSGRFGSYSSFVKAYCDWQPGEYGGFEIHGLKKGTGLDARIRGFTSILSKQSAGIALPSLTTKTIDLRGDPLRRVKAAAKLALRLPRPLCLMTWHVETAVELARLLGAELLTGKQTPKRRDRVLLQKPPLLVCTMRALGIGVNLIHWPNVVIVEPCAVPWIIEQALARFHRIGQTKKVRVWLMQYLGTADEAASIVLQDRIAHNKDFFYASESGEALLEAFSTGELEIRKELLRLKIADETGYEIADWR